MCYSFVSVYMYFPPTIDSLPDDLIIGPLCVTKGRADAKCCFLADGPLPWHLFSFLLSFCPSHSLSYFSGIEHILYNPPPPSPLQSVVCMKYFS